MSVLLVCKKLNLFVKFHFYQNQTLSLFTRLELLFSELQKLFAHNFYYKTLKAQPITKITQCCFTCNSSLLLVQTSQRVSFLLVRTNQKQWDGPGKVYIVTYFKPLLSELSADYRPSVSEGDTEIFIVIFSVSLSDTMRKIVFLGGNTLVDITLTRCNAV